RAINTVIKTLSQLLGKLVTFVKGLASKLAGAVVKGAKSILGKLGGFFKKVARWFSKLFGKLFNKLRKWFGRTAAQEARWIEFKKAVSVMLARHDKQGVTRPALK